MAMVMAENKILNTTLRVLQVIFALIVMGTDGYAIHVYHGYTAFVKTSYGGYYGYFGVPNEWGFLIFCAAWTVLVVVFQFIVGNASANRKFFGYFSMAIELVALISWFAGWIAVAVNTGTKACSEGYVSCGALKAAIVFGAFEWLLFLGTTSTTISLFLNSRRPLKTSAAGPSSDVWPAMSDNCKY